MPDLDVYLQTSFGPVVVLISAFISALVVSLIPFLAYPFKLFFTMIHELGHVFATRLSRGEVLGFFVFANDSGIAFRRGGDHLLIGPAGYLGTTIFSAALILLGGLPDVAPYTLLALGITLILAVLLYGSRSLLTLIVGLFFGSGFIGIAWFTQLLWSVFMVNLLALQGSFIAIRHLSQLARNLSGSDDASKMAQQFGCAPIFWVRSWQLLSLSILGTAFWFAWLRGW